MPARSAALPTGPTPAGPHLEALEAAHRELGLSYDDIARALGANASSLHRWRAGDTGPSRVFRHGLAALAELTAAAVVEPLVEPLPPAASKPGQREPEGPRIRRSGRPAGARA